MLRSLVGSEMCIRDRSLHVREQNPIHHRGNDTRLRVPLVVHGCHPTSKVERLAHVLSCHPPPRVDRRISAVWAWPGARGCLLYTSDAADEEDSVDLGVRRILYKKKKT
eukprot:TRINITY_DN16169_c0_g1_i2.p2 TRINITY_DN16169_c0_g1~~TRINITY_DN16169_c0_g1_i2.p2  ORF type:complete len:109 (+),score=21.93 TRINITY_DN16169_c0_g1_i2:132-458(+)